MKPDKQFEHLLLKSPISFDQQTLNRLNDYLSLIKHWSKKMNLVSYTDRRDIYLKHFVPSFWFYENIEQENPESILDIGSGAGFPGLILKIIKPEINVYMVESNRKKTLFLREVAEQLDINPQIINERIEKVITESDKTFDVIVSRAVTSLKQIREWADGLLTKNGVIFVIKGVDFKNEPDFEYGAGYNIYEIEPELKWINNSPNLKNKLLIKMKKA